MGYPRVGLHDEAEARHENAPAIAAMEHQKTI